MLYVTRSEKVFSNNEKINLKNVVRIDFYNRGSVDVKFGLYTIKASETYTYSTGGNITKDGIVDLKFKNNLPGELYADFKVFSCCLNN